MLSRTFFHFSFPKNQGIQKDSRTMKFKRKKKLLEWKIYHKIVLLKAAMKSEMLMIHMIMTCKNSCKTKLTYR